MQLCRTQNVRNVMIDIKASESIVAYRHISWTTCASIAMLDTMSLQHSTAVLTGHMHYHVIDIAICYASAHVACRTPQPNSYSVLCAQNLPY